MSALLAISAKIVKKSGGLTVDGDGLDISKFLGSPLYVNESVKHLWSGDQTLEDQVGGNDFIPTNTSVSYSLESNGYAMANASSSAGYFTASGIVELTQTYALSFFLKVKDFSPNKNEIVIGAQGNTPSGGSDIMGDGIISGWGGLTVYRRNGGTNFSHFIAQVDLPPIGEMVHLLYQRDNQNYSLYQDGVLLAQDTLSTFDSIASDKLVFGGVERPSGTMSGVNHLNKVYLFNKLLNNDEIQTLVQGTLPITIPIKD